MFGRLIAPALLLLLVLTAAGLGVFYPGDGSTVQSVSPRGQQYSYLASGIYRLNPVFFAREGRVWDVVNLSIAVPLFLLAWAAAIRGSMRGRLLLGGMQAYFFYVYLSCVMMYAFSGLFLIYVGIVAMSAVTFLQNMMGLNIDELPSRISSRFPRGLFAIYSFVLAGALIFLWGARILTISRTGLMPDDYAGLNTLGSQALDLGLLVPLAVATGIQLLRRAPLGYYLCSIAMVVGLMMFISIPSWIAVPLVEDGKASLFEAIPFFILSVAGIALALTYYFSVRGRDPQREQV